MSQKSSSDGNIAFSLTSDEIQAFLMIRFSIHILLIPNPASVQKFRKYQVFLGLDLACHFANHGQMLTQSNCYISGNND